MNIRCPECATVFRVDPARIPAAGVRARCSRCSASFRITPDGLGEMPVSAATRPPGADAQATSAPPSAEQPPPRPAPTSGTTGAMAPAATAGTAQNPSGTTGSMAPAATSQARSPGTPPPPAAPADSPSGAQADAATSASGTGGVDQTATETPRTPVFGSRDPNARAQRIARALVSDIVAYHPEKREHCLATGTLRSGFRDEIMKSWEEYVAQVGLDMAKTTPYFREALNNILAGGQQVF